MPKTLKLSDIAQRLGVSRPTAYNMYENGRIPVKPIEGTKPLRWNAEAIDTWLNSQNKKG